MARYIAISEDEIPIGRKALLLFVHGGELCAGIIEHRCDGRMTRDVASEPRPDQLIAAVGNVMAGRSLDDDFYVVLKDEAYWPEAFPSITYRN